MSWTIEEALYIALSYAEDLDTPDEVVDQYIADAIRGLLAEPDFVAAMRATGAAPQAQQPLKERPDFIAGYTAGLADGKACAERDGDSFNARADRLRIAGVTLIGLAEHDQRCDVFDLDDDGRHMACSCGLNESVKIIADAAHWTRAA